MNAAISGWTLSAVFLAAAIAGPQAQAPPRDSTQPSVRRIPVGDGVISGIVISEETGRPVKNARVSLGGQAGVAPAGRGVAPPARDTPAPPTLTISRTALTDGQGRFTFARLAAGRYMVSVSRDGYLSASYGQRRPNAAAAPMDLAEGQQRTISITLSRGGVLAGHVFDEDGEPMRSAQVQVWKFDRSTGVRRLQQWTGMQTNDRGAFRVFGLQPGSYVVSVVPRNNDAVPEATAADAAVVEQAIATGKVQKPASGPAFVTAPPVQRTATTRFSQPPGYLPVYFPGALTVSGAGVLTISGNEAFEAIDIPVQFVRATSIRGSVVPPPSGIGVQVALTSADGVVTGERITAGVNQEDGTFFFNSVAPGRYTLLAQSAFQASRLVESSRVIVDGQPVGNNTRIRVENVQSTPGADAESRMWAAVDIVVNGEPSLEVALTLQPARTISGRVTFNVSSANQPQGAITLQAVPAGSQLGPMPQSTVAADGTFTMKGVVPGRYYVRAPWTMSSVTLGAEDLFDLPFDVKGDKDLAGLEVTVTDKTAELHGTLLDASENPVSNYMVVVASVDERYWFPGSRRVLTATSNAYGRYTFRVPPGEYLVRPVADLENGAQYDPEVLAVLASSASRAKVEESGSVQRDFRVK